MIEEVAIQIAMFETTLFNLAVLPMFFERYPAPSAAAVIVLVGLLIYGFADLIRFSWRRTWAIAGACYTESVRKRVWLIPPLAIIGAIVVVQLQHPTDEADAIRQTLKFCLFATGLIVTISGVILACTNLPREIENRVIYTIVTKPTTRLEIVLGKVLGFAKVSALLLLVMGVFIYGYVHFRAWSLQRSVASIVQDPELDESVRTIYKAYQSNGLLQSRVLNNTPDFQVYSRLSEPNATVRYMASGGEGDMLVPFDLSLEDLTPPDDPTAPPAGTGILIAYRIGFERNPYAPQATARRSHLPIGIAAPEDPISEGPLASAGVQFQIMDKYGENLIAANTLPGNGNVVLKEPSGAQWHLFEIPHSMTGELLRYLERGERRIHVHVAGVNPEADYRIADESVKLWIPGISPNQAPRELLPMIDLNSGKPARPMLRGRVGLEGFQIKGGPEGRVPVGVFRFTNTAPPETDLVQFEVRFAIEKTGDDDDSAETRVQFNILNRKTGKLSEPVTIPIEARRTTFVSFPREFVEGGDFDLLVRSVTSGHYVSMFANSASYVAARGGFDLNLLKSLTVIWLMSLLVVTAAIFCSTFLSWPIAVVLTLLILLGHWGVQQLGDAIQPGIGAAMAQDIGLKDPGVSSAVSRSVEALARGLNLLGGILPDISKFSATEDIERGVSISAKRFVDSLYVLACYALPMGVLAYVILRKKEVAP